MFTKYVCVSCETVDDTRKATKGSFLMEVLLWCCFILPGVIYSLWRLTTTRLICNKCKSENVITADSPKGRRIVRPNMVEKTGGHPPLNRK